MILWSPRAVCLIPLFSVLCTYYVLSVYNRLLSRFFYFFFAFFIILSLSPFPHHLSAPVFLTSDPSKFCLFLTPAFSILQPGIVGFYCYHFLKKEATYLQICFDLTLTILSIFSQHSIIWCFPSVWNESTFSLVCLILCFSISSETYKVRTLLLCFSHVWSVLNLSMLHIWF